MSGLEIRAYGVSSIDFSSGWRESLIIAGSCLGHLQRDVRFVIGRGRHARVYRPKGWPIGVGGDGVLGADNSWRTILSGGGHFKADISTADRPLKSATSALTHSDHALRPFTTRCIAQSHSRRTHPFFYQPGLAAGFSWYHQLISAHKMSPRESATWQQQHGSPTHSSTSPLSCHPCRRLKRRCDRQYPRCGLCQR